MPPRLRPAKFPQRAGLLAASALLSAGCGSVGDPRPPLLHIPRPVEDLSARQVDASIQLGWTWPAMTTEGTIARQIGGFRVWAVDVPGFEDILTPETIDEYRREVTAIEPDELAGIGPGDLVAVDRPLVEWPLGQQAVVVVTALSPDGDDAGYSNQVRLEPLQPPDMPVWQSVEAVRDGVSLRWRSAQLAQEYAIERSRGDDGAFERLGRLAATSFLDRTVEWEATYRYRLRPLRMSSSGWIEGRASEATEITPLDEFPPLPPSGLRAVPTPTSIELSWLPVEDDDVEGYLVYRSGAAVSPLVAGPSFSDGSAPPGTQLVYAVTAVDSNGNESEPGEELAVRTNAVEGE